MVHIKTEMQSSHGAQCAGNCKVETRQRAKHIQVTFLRGLNKMGSREMGMKMDRARERTFQTGKIQGYT